MGRLNAEPYQLMDELNYNMPREILCLVPSSLHQRVSLCLVFQNRAELDVILGAEVKPHNVKILHDYLPNLLCREHHELKLNPA